MNIKTTNALHLGYPLTSLKSNLKTWGHSHRQAEDRLGHCRGETDTQTAGREKARDRLKTGRWWERERDGLKTDWDTVVERHTDRQLGERKPETG